MKPFTALLSMAALMCGIGCRRQEAGEKTSPPVEGDLLASYHFVGTAALANQPNGARLREIWRMPETRRLAEQTLQKLAHAPRTLFGERVSAVQDERGAALLRPMLDDLLRGESYLQVRGPANRTAEWTLLVQLPADRLKLWRASLTELMQLWMLGAPATNAVEGFAGWEVKRSDAPALVRCLEAGPWLVLGIGQNNLPAVAEAARRIKAGGRPVSPASNYWLQTELNLPRLGPALELPSAVDWPHARLTVIGQGENLRSNMRLGFSEPLTGSLDPWQVPTNLINEPLVSFTAARGISPWLKNCAALQKLELTPEPNELYLWAQGRQPIDRDLPYQTFVTFPLKDAAGKLERAGALAPSVFSTNWQSRGLAQVGWETNSHQLLWRGLPFITPFLAPAKFKGAEFVAGGLFVPSPSTNPVPAELLSQMGQQAKLVYYDWEITEARLHHWRMMAQLFAIIASKSQFTTNNAALPWLLAIEPKLGNTVTEITADSPTEWSLVRKANIGFTGFELVALARWLESTNFPALSFELPPERPLPTASKPPSFPANGPAAPAKKPPGG